MAAIGAGVLVLCLTSSVGAYIFNQGDNDELETVPKTDPTTDPTTGPTTDPTTVPTTGPTPPVPTPIPRGNVNGYHEILDFSIKTIDENCTKDTPVNACKTRCDYDSECISFSVSEQDECCINYETSDITYDDKSKVYVKSPNGYSIDKLGDRSGGLLSSDTTSNFTTCIDKCSKTPMCSGISYKKDVCELKKNDGLASSYSQNMKQFFKNANPKQIEPATQPQGLYSSTHGGLRNQSNNPDGEHLFWHRHSTSPWNKYYKFSCKNANGQESVKSESFGPISMGNYHGPKLRFADPGTKPCGEYDNVVIYRSNSENGTYTDLTRHMKNFNGGQYNRVSPAFTDTHGMGPVA